MLRKIKKYTNEGVLLLLKALDVGKLAGGFQREYSATRGDGETKPQLSIHLFWHFLCLEETF